jgi:hypothetical protein
VAAGGQNACLKCIMGRLKIKKTLFVMHDKDRNDRLKFKTNLLQKMLMTTLCLYKAAVNL